MNAYEKYFGSVEKAIEKLTSSGMCCPSYVGFKDTKNGKDEAGCYRKYCKKCWKQALEQEVEE